MIRFNSGVTSDFAASVFSSFASPAAAVVSLAAAAAVVAAGLDFYSHLRVCKSRVTALFNNFY